jgi:hypothetical protein
MILNLEEFVEISISKFLYFYFRALKSFYYPEKNQLQTNKNK